ncbi:NRDE family protein [Aquabacterium sp. A3]|uniref:NRDE family protein n=1 Tax=Aquabacterium sp. A3 TaxID=3132829 RepID=UPI003119BE83
MCLVAFALDQHSRFPFVLAANRDEFFDRQAARLGWWQPDGDGPAILGGRDLSAGGTWLGLTAYGRLGLVTNIRNPEDNDPSAPSRGDIVPQWLKGDVDMATLWPRLAMSGYNGFNMIALDFAQAECFWLNNRRLYPERLQKGIFGLSNAQLNTPWPKVQQLKAQLKLALAAEPEVDALAHRLMDALANPEQAADAHLPHTGVPLPWERLLSSCFIRSADGSYGTRCSTIVITERQHKRLVTHVFERTFTPRGVALLRQVTLKNWPPRHTAADADVARLQATLPQVAKPRADKTEDVFETSEVSELDNHVLPPMKRTRARNLIKAPVLKLLKA